MKLAFIWYWDQASRIFPNWRDGLRAAIEDIAIKNEVSWFMDKQIPREDYDSYLVWDDSNTKAIDEISTRKGVKGLCLTTYPSNIDNLKKFDVVFVESQPIYDAIRPHGIKTIKAFGTDTSYFVPGNINKDIEYFYPATFSPWKRQSSIAHLGEKLLCVGTTQPDGVLEKDKCIKKGVVVEDGYFPVEKILNYYQRSKNVIIPAIHGSERTVLEAMACNILPTVYEQNERASSYLKEYKESGFRFPRDFILSKYSHKIYAQNLMRGLCFQ